MWGVPRYQCSLSKVDLAHDVVSHSPLAYSQHCAIQPPFIRSTVVSLTRIVRFIINSPDISPAQPPDASTAKPVSGGGYSGIPAMRGLGRFYELEVRCVGDVHPIYSYLVDIKDIDHAVRESAVPIITRAVFSGESGTQPADPGRVLIEILPILNLALSGRVASVRLHLSPYYSLELSMPHPQDAARDADKVTLLRRKYDFAAAHRLHVPSLSSEENARLFGKCNNPRGHGHNYQVEPCVAVESSTQGLARFSARTLDSLVARDILDRFDHKHLNEDTTEFATGTGLNPSVENIARVFFEILAPSIRAAGAELRHITVWETDRTSSTYPG